LQVDGCETYGFPFNFYEVCADPPIDFEGGFRVNYIIYDFLIPFGLVFLLFTKPFLKNNFFRLYNIFLYLRFVI
jgi:hypothetical protein